MKQFDRELDVDRLTGLPNLFSIIRDLKHTPPRESGLMVAFDLTNFAQVNQVHGETVGDCVIQVAATSLRESCTLHDADSHLYRIGGDEFLACLPGTDREEMQSFVESASERFSDQLQIASLPQVSIRHSAVLYPFEAKTLAAALVRLYLTMRTAKEEKDQIFSPQGDLGLEHLVDRLLGRFEETLLQLHETREVALTDAISGLANHRAGESALTSLTNRYIETKQEFSVLFVDGDNLKVYNEQLGYDGGNTMIRHLGKSIASSVREDDRVCRWFSGDEFMILLPNTDRQEAYKIANRLRRRVISAFAGWPHPVTISVGVASCPEDGSDPHELVKKAANANVKAKRLGKNRVV